MANPVIRQKKLAGAGTSVAVSYNSLPLTGSLLIAATYAFGTASAPGASTQITVPTDNAGAGTSGAWQKLGEYRDNNGNIVHVAWNVVDGTPAGTATVTSTAALFNSIHVYEITGWDAAAGPLDSLLSWSTTGTGATAFTDLITGNIDALLMAFLIDQGTDGSWGFTFNGTAATVQQYDTAAGTDANAEWSFNATTAAHYTPASTGGASDRAAVAIAIKSDPASFLPQFTAQPTNQVVAEGSPATIAATVTNYVSLQWERMDPLGTTFGNVSGGSGGTTNSYATPNTVRANDAGALYRLKATNAAGFVYSNVVLLRVTVDATATDTDGLLIGGGMVGDGKIGAPANAPSGLAAAGSMNVTGSAALSTLIQMVLSGTANAAGTAALGTSIRFGANGASGATGSAALGNAIQMAAVGSVQANGAAGLVTQIPIAAAGAVVVNGSAAISTSVSLAAAGAMLSTGQAGLSAQIFVSAAGLAQALGSAGFSTQIPLAAAGQATVGGSADLTAPGASGLAASGAMNVSGSAGLTVTITLGAAGIMSALGAAGMLSQIRLAAAGQVAAAGAASLSTAEPLAAAGVVSASGNAGLVTQVPLAAVGAVVVTGSAQLGTAMPLAAAGASTVSGSGALQIEIRLSAAGLAQLQGQAGFVTQISLGATGLAQVLGSAFMGSNKPLQPSGHRSTAVRRIFVDAERARAFRAAQPSRRFAFDTSRAFKSSQPRRSFASLQ